MKEKEIKPSKNFAFFSLKNNLIEQITKVKLMYTKPLGFLI